jgi:hypothetical protein
MTKLFSSQQGVVWNFEVTGNMLGVMDDATANLFFNTLEDSIEKVCFDYNVDLGK